MGSSPPSSNGQTPNRLTLMTVHAHPDDEIWTGGILADAANRGIHTVLVTATLGEEGEIHDPDLDPEEARHRLAAIREEELARAAAILGIAEVHLLRYRDSGMVGTPANANPDSFMNVPLSDATRRLVRLIREVRPQVIATYDERGFYGHPDHIAANRATVSAFDAAGDAEQFPELNLPPWQPQKLYYNAFARSDLRAFRDLLEERGLAERFQGEEGDFESITTPDDVVTTRVDVGQYVPRKLAALHAHRTQISPNDPLLNLPEDVMGEMFRVETYTLALATRDFPRPETDLFAGVSPHPSAPSPS